MMQLQVEVSITPTHEHGYGNLHVKETVSLTTLSFMEMSSILARFHDLATLIQQEHKARK